MSNKLNNLTKRTYLASCLYDCIEDNNFRSIKKLLEENEANPNTILPDKGVTPFHLAVGSGNEDFAEKTTSLFLNFGGNPNISSKEKLTPVHIAAAWGRLKVLNILLKCGGDPILVDEEGKTALDYAKDEEHWNVVEYLENYLQTLHCETEFEKLYNFTLNKLIIKNGDIVAEYGDKNEVNKDSYVNDWCTNNLNFINTTNNDKFINKDLNISLKSIKESPEKNFVHNLSTDDETKEYSRESGILTISSHSESSANFLNDNIVVDSENTTSEYLTCNSLNIFDKNITSSLITLDLSEKDEAFNIPSLTSDSESICVTEEYKYTDKEEGIVLIEQRLLVNPRLDENKSVISTSSKVSTLPSVLEYDTDTLRCELTSRGEPPGPITKTTKRIYLKKLKKLQKHPIIKDNQNCKNKVYSVELEKTLRNPKWTQDLSLYQDLEKQIVNQFSKPEPTKRWREGITKASFTYLLLDPRITKNLPGRSTDLDPEESWKTFLNAVFYVGKGKRSRPYSHLYEAVNYFRSGDSAKSRKIDYILDIWNDHFGVVCLHIFQNVIPVEAYTREAAMINALKLQNLCNSKTGDFYGVSSTWPERKKRLLGVYLLYRAMLIFLNEGERQLRPDDIGK